MELLFSPLFSGSDGNCTYVGTREEAVIVDAGMSMRAILEEMDRAQLDPGAVRALLVTHEHTDHISGVGALARKLNVPIYATPGTWRGMEKRAGKLQPGQRREIECGADFYIGNINVTPFSTLHDTNEPCGYAFDLGGLRASIATDIGCVRENWLSTVLGSDIVLLEADYDPDMLMAGFYTYELKRRIRGTHGHLSNEDAGKAACRLVASGTKHIILGHMSKNNNFPELALRTVEDILAQEGYLCGRDVNLYVARREGLTGVFRIASAPDEEQCNAG